MERRSFIKALGLAGCSPLAQSSTNDIRPQHPVLESLTLRLWGKNLVEPHSKILATYSVTTLVEKTPYSRQWVIPKDFKVKFISPSTNLNVLALYCSIPKSIEHLISKDYLLPTKSLPQMLDEGDIIEFTFYNALLAIAV